MQRTPSTPTKTASTPTKTASTPNIDLRCFVARQFFVANLCTFLAYIYRPKNAAAYKNLSIIKWTVDTFRLFQIRRFCFRRGFFHNTWETVHKLSGSNQYGVLLKILKFGSVTWKLSLQLRPWNKKYLICYFHLVLVELCHGSENSLLISFLLGSLHHEGHSFLQFGPAGPHHHQDWRARCSGNDGNGRTKSNGIPPHTWEPM